MRAPWMAEMPTPPQPKTTAEEPGYEQLMLAGEALNAAMNVFLAAAPPGQGPGKRSIVIGTVKGDVIEIQGDHRAVLVEQLSERGYTVKLAGG